MSAIAKLIEKSSKWRQDNEIENNTALTFSGKGDCESLPKDSYGIYLGLYVVQITGFAAYKAHFAYIPVIHRSGNLYVDSPWKVCEEPDFHRKGWFKTETREAQVALLSLLGMSVEDLSAQFGYPMQSVRAWITGTSILPIKVVKFIQERCLSTVGVHNPIPKEDEDDSDGVVTTSDTVGAVNEEPYFVCANAFEESHAETKGEYISADLLKSISDLTRVALVQAEIMKSLIDKLCKKDAITSSLRDTPITATFQKEPMQVSFGISTTLEEEEELISENIDIQQEAVETIPIPVRRKPGPKPGFKRGVRKVSTVNKEGKPKRKRRTPAEMAAARAVEAENKKK